MELLECFRFELLVLGSSCFGLGLRLMGFS